MADHVPYLGVAVYGDDWSVRVMAEYIERDLLNMAIESELFFTESTKAAFRNIARKVPAADVVEVVHGRWVPCEPDRDVRFYCSECGTEISTSWDYDCDEMWNGCPHCLARMDGADG